MSLMNYQFPIHHNMLTSRENIKKIIPRQAKFLSFIKAFYTLI